jgi:hypothetical protein
VKVCRSSFPDSPENTISQDSSLVSESNVNDADPVARVSTGGTSCEPSNVAAQVKASACAGLALLETIPTSKTRSSTIASPPAFMFSYLD